jgi:hypothetical protein
MLKARAVLLSLLAMLSVSALTSAAAVASTHSYKIEGSELTGSEKAEVNIEGRQTTFATTIAGSKIDINCEEVEGPSKTNVLEKEGKSKFELEYKDCNLFNVNVEKGGKGKVERLPACKVKEPFTLKGEGQLKGTAGVAEDELKGTEESERLGTLTIESINKESPCALAGTDEWDGFWFQEWWDPWTGIWHIQWPDWYWWQFWHVKIGKAGEPVFARGSLHSTLASGKEWSNE